MSAEAVGDLPFPSERGACRITLSGFEGPLDLLLYLIRRDEMEVEDIPMALVADQYLEYVRQAVSLDIDVASEYLVMAATLASMKSRSLLPRREESEGAEDPGEELRRQLILYRAFREIAAELQRKEEDWRQVYTPPGERERWTDRSPPRPSEGEQATLLDLLLAMEGLTREERQPAGQSIRRRLMTVAECIAKLDDMLQAGEERAFSELVGPVAVRSRVVTFYVTVLELVRRGWLDCRQPFPFADLGLRRTGRWPLDA